jgi:hypothetical protein
VEAGRSGDDEGGESLRRRIMCEGKGKWDWLIIMTGPCDAAELRKSNDGGFRKCSNPGKDWI